MALRVTKQFDTGLEVDCYAVLCEVAFYKDKNLALHVKYYLYNSAPEGEQATHRPIASESFVTDSIPENWLSDNAQTIGYVFLKSLPEFAGAVDV